MFKKLIIFGLAVWPHTIWDLVAPDVYYADSQHISDTKLNA